MTEPEVVVRGYAVVPGRPDEAEMGLTVTSLDESADAALSDAVRKSRQLESVLDELDVPKSARVTAGLTLHQEREYERERWRNKGFRASNEIKVRIDDLSLVGRLMTEATRRADARVEGPHWRIRLENPARAEACRQAATEARRKAEAYAEALGQGLGGVIRISEPGVGIGRRGEAAAFAVASAAGPSDEMAVETGDLDVTAVVEVAFRLEPNR
jgi:uncharacterized protein YggE